MPSTRETVGALQALLQAGKAHEAVDRILGLSPDPESRLAAAIGWSLVGNFHRAREALFEVPREGLPAKLEANRRQVRLAVEEGFRNERAGLEANRKRNLEALARSQPELADRLGREPLEPLPFTWIRTAPGLEFVRLGKDRLEVVDERPSEAALRELDQVVAESQPLLFVGLRYGVLLLRAVRSHRDMPNGQLVPYYVLEPNPAILSLHLALGDVGGLTTRGNVLFFTGPACRTELAKHLEADPTAPLPLAVAGGDPEAEARPLHEENQRAVEAARERSARYYGRLSLERLAARFRGEVEDPLRVLFLTSRFTTVLQYSTRDLAEAFERLGCRTLTLKERRATGTITRRALDEAIADFQPDLIFNIDHIRPELAPLPANLPFVCWIQDNMPRLRDADLVRELTRLDLTYYAMAPGWFAAYQEAGFHDLSTMHMAVNDRLFSIPERAKPSFACELAFASHVAWPKAEGFPDAITRWFIDAVRDEDRGEAEFEFYDGLADRAAARFGLRLDPELRQRISSYVMLYVVRYVTRTEPVRWAIEAGVDVRLYGTGWETIPDLAPRAMGPVTNGEDLRDLYHAAKIHLHINHHMNLHQRLYECIASGGFLLARAAAADHLPGNLADQFEIGREIVTFTDRTDFLAKVRHYLDHEEERQRVIEAGRARVLAEHTYVHRARRILADVRKRLNAITSGQGVYY